MQLSVIYPFRDRELNRVKISLDSLKNQINNNFDVLFVDYGSQLDFCPMVQTLVNQYPFATYFYSYTADQPWSRAKAVNIGLKATQSHYVFIADIDMIFKNNFIDVLYRLMNPNTFYFFKVGFLSKNESNFEKKFDDYKINHTSDEIAQGLSLFCTAAIKAINGFDEFLHFWGAEDINVHNRLIHSGYKRQFFDSEILMLHRWHLKYNQTTSNVVSKYLQLTNIANINQHYCNVNNYEQTTIANNNIWGTTISKTDHEYLQQHADQETIFNFKHTIDHFLFVRLKNFSSGTINIRFVEHSYQFSLKYRVKKIFRLKTPQYYSLKEINDKLLLHIISFYNQDNYSFKIGPDLKSIEFKMAK